MRCDRRGFIAEASLGLAAFAAAGIRPAVALPEPARDALGRLMEGNQRFVADRAACPPLTARRLELAQGQSPFAIVLSCSDSRVPVETIFDQVPGNIFGVRVAGNFVDDNGLGSIEYAVAVLKSSLVLVLGHSQCGAVKASLEYVKNGTTQPGKIQGLVAAIAPAAKASKAAAGDWLDNAIARNVHDNIAAVKAQSSIVGDAVRFGSLAIAGGVYDLHSGKVSIVH